jgi:ABC-type nitrate/sulfonate/bicarbonate transport system substrate-binding protein
MAGGKKRLRAALIAFGLTLAVFVRVAAAGDRPLLTLQLPGEAGFEFAGYYAALWHGFYRDAGIEVEIRPGGTAIDPVREVVEGRARFGVGDMRLLVRIAQGLPLVLLAPIFQESGAAIYYRADSNFTSPDALAGATIGRLPPTSALDIEYRALLQTAGIDPERVKSVAVGPGDIVAGLAERRFDAAVGSAWEVPWRAYRRGLALKALPMAGPFYGDTLFATERFAHDEPGVVAVFRAATLKGWEYALANPGPVVARFAALARDPAASAERAALARYQSEIARRLAHYPKEEIARSDPQRWRRIGEQLVRAGAIQHSPALAEALYQPDRFTAGNLLRPGFAVIGVGLLAAGGLWWRRQRRGLADFGEGPIDLDALLTALEPRLRRRLPRTLRFRLSLAPGERLCRADPAALSAAVIDLAREAADEMAGEGEIVVGARDRRIDEAARTELPDARPGDYVRLSVKDNGPGLSADLLDEIFDPAETLRPAAARARALALRLGGFAVAESAEGVGTAIHLYFRREPAAEGATAPTPEKEPRAEAA